MKKLVALGLFIICALGVFLFLNNKKSNTVTYSESVSKFEVSQIEFKESPKDYNDTLFNNDNMNIIHSWLFTVEKDIRDMLQGIRNEPDGILGAPAADGYNNYLINISYRDGSTESWILWLDKEFQNDGVAFNKENPGRFFKIDKKYMRTKKDLLK